MERFCQGEIITIAISKLKLVKHPGQDEITTEMLRWGKREKKYFATF